MVKNDQIGISSIKISALKRTPRNSNTLIKVEIPKGYVPGSKFPFQAPDGRILTVAVPPGLILDASGKTKPGQTMDVQFPLMAVEKWNHPGDAQCRVPFRGVMVKTCKSCKRKIVTMDHYNVVYQAVLNMFCLCIY